MTGIGNSAIGQRAAWAQASRSVQNRHDWPKSAAFFGIRKVVDNGFSQDGDILPDRSRMHSLEDFLQGTVAEYRKQGFIDIEEHFGIQ